MNLLNNTFLTRSSYLSMYILAGVRTVIANARRFVLRFAPRSTGRGNCFTTRTDTDTDGVTDIGTDTDTGTSTGTGTGDYHNTFTNIR